MPDRSAAEVLRAGRRRARYYAALARQPRLAGTPLSFGPRTSFRLGAEGSVDRGPRCVIAGDFHGYFEAPARWGADIFFNVGAYVCVFDGLTIGSRCRFGERVSIHDEDHAVDGDPDSYQTTPVSIGDDVWVGANVVILRGATIGPDSVIAAGAVVRGHIPANSLAAGVPARVVRPLHR